MSMVSHQTIKLSKGKHSSPQDGACVMELASMLAGERFTDHPETVSPSVGSFLRAYNDSVDDDRRQDLYDYASRVVGSRGSDELERARADRLMEWAAARQPISWARLLPPQLRAMKAKRRPSIDAAGTHAVHAIRRHTEETHAAVLALVDELLMMGPESSPVTAAEAGLAPEPAEVIKSYV